MLKKFLFSISAAAVITASGCTTEGESNVRRDTVVKPVVINVAKIQIKPYHARITAGHKANFQVEGIDAAGKKINLTADWKIIEGKTDIGTLDKVSGNKVSLTTEKPGSITIMAEYYNHKATAAVEVVKRQ
jgi:hypothetical protein